MRRLPSRLVTAALILASLALVSEPAQAKRHGGIANGAAAPTCPFAGDNGCAAANQNGSFQNTSLLTSAQQSGQNSLLPTHPMTFNIPGVDYPIGPDKTLTPRDPRTISTANCSYTAAPTEIVQCFGTGVINIVLDNYDFSGAKIGKAPVYFYIGGSPSVGSTIAITNSYFYTLNTTFGVSTDGAMGFAGNWNITLKNDQFDGSIADQSSGGVMRDDGLTLGTVLDIEYNDFINVYTQRLYNSPNSGTAAKWKYNFIEGMGAQNNFSHGEVALMSCGGGGGSNCANKTISEFRAEGNFIINDTYSDAYCSSGGGGGGCVMSGLFFNGAGATHGIKYTAVNMLNNVTVTNTAGAPGGGPATPSTSHIWGESLFASGWASVGTYTVTGNYTDATGATFCTVSGPANGSESVTASQSGTVITITGTSSSYNNNPVEPGWQFWRGGIVVATITSMGTSGGNLGTVNVDTSASIGSDSLWTLVPGITTGVLSNNWNLADPSHVGTPTALGMVMPTLKPANCLGAHN